MNCKTPPIFISKRTYDAIIFDLDGVVTRTARVHAAAWKKLFDGYLKERAEREGEKFQPFGVETDYRRYVDGKPRYQGVKSFLDSRGIELPCGDPEDPPDRETVCGLGNRKNRLFREHLEQHGVETYDSTIDLIRRLKRKGIRVGVVSSSKNCAAVLEAAGIAGLFDTKVNGVDAARLNLEGKPAPDIFLEAARQLGVDPARAIIVEDAIAGVQAGRRGRFGYVIGVDRTGQGADLKENGADLVVTDLFEIAVGEEASTSSASTEELPSAVEHVEEITQCAKGMRLAVFLDYDGTLTPIVDRPDQAVLSDVMRATVRKLAGRCIVAIISGRDLRDVQNLVDIREIFYAGSHGFDIAGPEGRHMEYQQGTDYLPALDRAAQELEERLGKIAGILVERKKFAIAVHYRMVAKDDLEVVERAVDEVLEEHPGLRKSGGKKIYELRPNIDWHKGKAVLWLLEVLDLDRPDVLPLYIGDDLTDEDAFRALEGRGIGLVVRDEPRRTAARYALEDPEDVGRFLERLASMLEEND